MPVSIKDIAKKAGVSPSTVSRALHNHPRISAETKTHIQDLARAMGYVPSRVARNLVAKRSATIGVAVSDLQDPYYARLISGIEDVAAAHNYHVVLSSFYRDPKRELEIVHDFHERRMEGIIVTSSKIDQDYLSTDSKFFMPIILINSPLYPYSVSINGFTGAKKVVRHLIELGHRRIAHVTWGAEHHDGLNRLSGYQAALSEHNIQPDEGLIVAGDGGITGGIKAVPQLLDLPQPPTAVFSFNDLTAIGVINALRRRGYEVPDDFSVTGYDDLEMAAYYHPPLTTVRQPTYRVGQMAINMLLKLIKGDRHVVPEILEPEFVSRESTSPVAR
jgi:DNA-binding LacI/PurR family transcriptional regulator